MRLYRRIYHRADRGKKERGDSLVPLLLPSVLGIAICTICICGMTWAWFSANVSTPVQTMTSACYEVTVGSVMNGDAAVVANNGNYLLEKDVTYTVTLTASGTVKECGGYCLIQNNAEEKTYTQTLKPDQSITVLFTPASTGNYTFSGVWGSLPAGTENYLKTQTP